MSYQFPTDQIDEDCLSSFTYGDQYSDRQLQILAKENSTGLALEKVSIARQLEPMKKKFYEKNRLAPTNSHRKNPDFVRRARQVYILSNGGELPPENWIDNPPVWLP